MSLAQKIYNCFKNTSFTLKEAYEVNKDIPKTTIRGRIYDNLGIRFERIAKGVYTTLDEDVSCVVVEGNGRDLHTIKDNSIDCIITDHPWDDKKSNKGGNRKFANYNCFQYTLEDFIQKARVLKEGSFLVEFLPSENENNYKYLYQIKKMAEQAGFKYYSKVPWIKGTFVSNTGRKAKNSQDVMIFSKGKARSLRLDAKKSKKLGYNCYMSGCNGMLPTEFNVQPVPKKERIHQAEMPINLIEQILSYTTNEGEVVLDQFAGSGVVGEACLNKKRNCILFEILEDNILKIKKRLGSTIFFKTANLETIRI